MDTQKVLELAARSFVELKDQRIDVISISQPTTVLEAVNLSRIVSKLSPIVGNLLEFKTVDLLNDIGEFEGLGEWVRQDPEFPDALFEGEVSPKPGFELKAWFPLATEITARFKDSQLRFADNATWVAMPAWLPSQLICGEPTILDVCIVSGASVAKARDDHYYNPPDYLVIEPGNTADRTINLQQSNTAGYKWQGTPGGFEEAKRIVDSWGSEGGLYSPGHECQARVQELLSMFEYRLDTNFAKIDRINHPEIEAFKSKVLGTDFRGRTIREWSRLIARHADGRLHEALSGLLQLDTIK
jgi:hypothetical protein